MGKAIMEMNYDEASNTVTGHRAVSTEGASVSAYTMAATARRMAAQRDLKAGRAKVTYKNGLETRVWSLTAKA